MKIIERLGCSSHQVITDVVTDQNAIGSSTEIISQQLKSSNQLTIKSVMIGTLNNVQTVEEVKMFLQNNANETYPIVLHLNNDNQWNNDVFQTTITSILPFCSVVIITCDAVLRLLNTTKQSVRNIAVNLLKMGPQAIVMQDASGQRHVTINDDNQTSRVKHFILQSYCSTLCTETFSIVTAAFLAHDDFPLTVAISYGDIYSATEKLTPSPFLRIPALTYTQELWSSVNDIYNRTLELPFLKKMLDGTLDERIYDYYIIQDHYFLIDRGNMLDGLINQCTNNEELRQFFIMQSEKNKIYVRTILTENNLSLCNENPIRIMPACASYTKFLRKVGKNRKNGSEIGLITLLPCTLKYAKIGDWMIASGLCPTVKRYAAFIEQYRDQARHDRLAYFLELTNRMVSNCSYKLKQKLKKIFRNVCKHEYAFWDDAYRYGLQRIGGNM